MKELKKLLKEEEDMIDFINLHLRGMKIVIPITYLYFIFIPNSNELFFFGSLVYTIYFKILQLIYKNKFKKTNNKLQKEIKRIKKETLIKLQKEKSKSKQLSITQTKSEYKYHFKENSPTIKTTTFYNIKNKKLIKKR